MGQAQSQAEFTPKTPAEASTCTSFSQEFSNEEIDAACGQVTRDSDVSSTDDALSRAPTILLVGATGTGKTSLINTTFNFTGNERAETRAGGAPCTTTFYVYGPTREKPVCLVDSRGLERKISDEQRQHLLRYLARANGDRRVRGYVDVVWYLPDERWEVNDDDNVRSLREFGLPVIVVINKCDTSTRKQRDGETGLQAMHTIQRVVQETFPGIPVFLCGNPALADDAAVATPSTCANGHAGDLYFVVDRRTRTWECDFLMDGEDQGRICGLRGSCQLPVPFGLRELLDATSDAMHILRRRSFVSAQRVVLEERRRLASKLIARAFGVGLNARDSSHTVQLEKDLVGELFALYNVRAPLPDDALLRRLNGMLVKSGRWMLSPSTIQWCKNSIFAYYLGTVLEAFVGALAMQAIGMAVVMTVEKLLYSPSSRDSSQITQDEFRNALVSLCARQDVSNMDRERNIFARRMGAVDEDLQKYIEGLSVEVETAIRRGAQN